MSGWKFRKHPGSNGKALFTRVNQKSNEMDVVALPGTLLQFRRRKWNVAQKLNNFDFLAIAAVCCFFCWKRYKQSSKLPWVYRCRCHFERYDKKWKEKLWLSVNNLTSKHWKWREKFQAPAAGRTRIAQIDQKFLFQPVETEKVEYLGRSPVYSEKISNRTARSICN